MKKIAFYLKRLDDFTESIKDHPNRTMKISAKKAVAVLVKTFTAVTTSLNDDQERSNSPTNSISSPSLNVYFQGLWDAIDCDDCGYIYNRIKNTIERREQD